MYNRAEIECFLYHKLKEEDVYAIISALLKTGRVQRLDPTLMFSDEVSSISPRQEPPVLEGTPVSEIIIEQRRA